MKQQTQALRTIAETAAKINIQALPSVLYINKTELPRQPGIYFVGTDENPNDYIGCTETSLKVRFCGHHRKKSFEQLMKENGAENVKVRFWLAPTMPKDTLRTYLLFLEKQLIQTKNPKINYTHISDPKVPKITHFRKTYFGPIYVQLNQLSKYSVDPLLDGQGGCRFSHSKLSCAESAEEAHAPVFLISSGSWSDAYRQYGSYISKEWKQYTTLYFLSLGFYANKIEYVGPRADGEFNLWGNRAVYGQALLNEQPYFKDFSIKYLRGTGLINCCAHPFSETLLSFLRKEQ